MSDYVFVTPNLLISIDNQRPLSSIQAYWPAFYLNISDFVKIADIEDAELEQVRNAMSQLFDDQFILSAGRQAIRRREQMLGIQADDSTETLDFRRRRILNRYQAKPPFTVRYLQQQLDRLVGQGMTVVSVDIRSFVLVVTTNIDNAMVFREVQHTIETVKPANMTYRQNTALNAGIELEQQLAMKLITWNYKFDGSWALGARPFVSYGQEVPIL